MNTDKKHTYFSTTDYDKFVMVKGNRPVSSGRQKKTEGALQVHDMLNAFPVVVRKENGVLPVLEGQGRVLSAKKLGLPVYYIVDNTIKDDEIGGINELPKNWTTRDFLNWFADRGSSKYRELRRFIKDTGIPITAAVGLWCGSNAEMGSTSKHRIDFKKGQLQTGDKDHAYAVATVLGVMRKEYNISFATNRSLVLAMSKLLRVKQFDAQRFLKKLGHQSYRFVRCANWEQYVDLIDDVYNHKCRSNQLVSLATEVKKLRAA